MTYEANRGWFKKRSEAASEAIENFNCDAEEYAIDWAWATITTLETKLAAAEQRAEQLEQAERNAVRECYKLAVREDKARCVRFQILNRYPQHFEGDK